MRHVRLSTLPRTRPWQKVVGLLGAGAAAGQLAAATLAAAERWFAAAADDPGAGHAVWLLMHLPFAARPPDFPAALAAAGVHASPAPGLVELSDGEHVSVAWPAHNLPRYPSSIRSR